MQKAKKTNFELLSQILRSNLVLVFLQLYFHDLKVIKINLYLQIIVLNTVLW